MLKKISASRIYLYVASAISVLALLIHFFTNGKIFVAMHDTYFALEKLHFFLVYILLFLFFASVSWLFENLKRPLIMTLCIIHCLCTLPGILFLAVYNNQPTGNYSDNSVYDGFATYQSDLSYWVALIIGGLLFIGILIFLLNVIVSFARKRNPNFR